MEFITELKLDLEIRNTLPVVRVKQGDSTSRKLLIYLKKNGETYIPETDCWIAFRCEKPDGHSVVYDSMSEDTELGRYLVISGLDGTVTVELVSQVTAACGHCLCDICIYKGTESISTIPFLIDVRKSPNIMDRAASSDDFRTFINAIELARHAVGSLFWQSKNEPTVTVNSISFDLDDLVGREDKDPKVGDLVFYSYYYYEITEIQNGMAYVADGVSIRGGPTGKLWTVQDIYLLRQVLEHLKYDSSTAGEIAEALLSSLESTTEPQGWTVSQVSLLDSLFSHVKYIDESGGVYADTLIESLKGQLVELGGTITLSENGTYNIGRYANAVVDTPTYSDGDEVKY